MSIQGIFVSLIQVIEILVIARVIMSWVMAAGTRNQFMVTLYQMVHQLTEPMLAPLRRVLPPMGGFDLSPIILFLLLGFVQRAVISAL